MLHLVFAWGAFSEAHGIVDSSKPFYFPSNRFIPEGLDKFVWGQALWLGLSLGMEEIQHLSVELNSQSAIALANRFPHQEFSF